MMSGLIAVSGVVAAYLIGSIPFGLLIARWFGKVDIRTVGSGNIGATNVGRVLGFRYFVVVFLLDYLKGFLPTYFFPLLAARAAGSAMPDLAVGLAIASILGHNFPIYLKFKGGKGVATSLGAVSALDPIATVASATGFTIFLLFTRFVSMSSILGGLVWVFVHFARIPNPWSREQIAMSLATLGLMGLLVVRHRKNIVRIANGTEPKVNFRKKKGDAERRSGKAGAILIVVLVALGGAAAFAFHSGKKAEIIAGPYRVSETARVATGHQRAERLTFADQGRLLAATCPRYGRAMLYRVTEARTLDLVRDITLGGRPVAIHATVDRLYVLVRPNNDARHVEEGWWVAFDFEGKPVGPKVPVGLYPDDISITADGRHALILTSGRGEGGNHRPSPSLTIYELGSPPKVSARLTFDQPGDDPSRLAVSTDGQKAAVSLLGSSAVAWVDLSDLANPRLLSRTAWPTTHGPDAVRFDHQGGLLATNEGDESLWYVAGPTEKPVNRPVEGGAGDVIEIPGAIDTLVYTQPFDSSVALLRGGSRTEASPDRFPIRGHGNLSATRPLGLAYNPDRKLLAVSNRSGGSIHLVALDQAGK